MNDFWVWLFDRQQIFTIVTVVLSGLISWVVSALYFQMGNRNSLRVEILYPMKHIIEEGRPFKINYNSLVEILKNYNSRYLKRCEQKTIDALLSSYKEVCGYNYNAICADSLFSYFCYTLKQNNIETKIDPIFSDGEKVASDIPSEICGGMTDSLKNAIEKYPLDNDDGLCLRAIQIIFKEYCKEFTKKEINFFDDYSLQDVLSKSKSMAKWDEKFSNYNKAKEAFLKLKIFK